MSELNLQSSVGRWVSQHPQTSRVFESCGIDYCCGGSTLLQQACRDQGLVAEEIVSRLEVAIRDEAPPSEDWLHAPLTELCDHIERTHHAYLRRELPRLTELIAKVVAAHGDAHRSLAGLQQVFASLRAELEPHMFKEEQILFPAIRQLEASSEDPSFPFGTVANPIRVMEHEHDNAGDALLEIRRATNEFTAPADACNTYRAMLDGLHDLDGNMRQHVHKENNILFPRALKLEASRGEVSGVSESMP